MTREQKVAVLGVFIVCAGSVLCFVATPDMIMAVVCSVAIASVTATVFYMDSSKINKNRVQTIVSAANKELHATTKHCEKKIADLIQFLHALTDPAAIDLRNDMPTSVPSGLPLAD